MLTRYKIYDDDGSERSELIKRVKKYQETLIDNSLNYSGNIEAINFDDVDDIVEIEKKGFFNKLVNKIHKRNQLHEENQKKERLDCFNNATKYFNVISSNDKIPTATFEDEYEIRYTIKIRSKYNSLAFKQKEDLIRCKIQNIKIILNKMYSIVFIVNKTSENPNYYFSDFSDYYHENENTINEFLESLPLTVFNLFIKYYFYKILNQKVYEWNIEEDRLEDLIALSLINFELILKEILLEGATDPDRDPFFDGLEKEYGAVGYAGEGKYYPKVPLVDLCTIIVRKNFKFNSSDLHDILVKGKNDNTQFNKQGIQRSFGKAREPMEEYE